MSLEIFARAAFLLFLLWQLSYLLFFCPDVCAAPVRSQCQELVP